jgi:hypothetical protein
MTNEICLGSIFLDSNFDGVVSIGDIMRLIKTLFFFPGDAVLSLMYGSALGNFFEITSFSCGNFFSVVVSAVSWVVALFILAFAFD